MAKLAREHKLREKRAEKQARKEMRKDAAADTRLSGESELPASPEHDPAVTDATPVTEES